VTPLVYFDPEEISDWFWDIVARADRSPDTLKHILSELPDNQVRRFALEFLDASGRFNQESFTRYLGPSYSEDGVADMTEWVVSQGKDFFLTVWNHPETVEVYDVGKPEHRVSLVFVAEEILEERLGDWPDIMEDYAAYARSGIARVSDYVELQQKPESDHERSPSDDWGEPE